MLHAEFKVLGGKHQGRSIPINTKKFLVGREQDCHLRPNNDLVSRHHCVFLLDDFAVRLRDLGSTNGTRVNGELVRGERVLQDGDRIAIGKLELEIVIGKRAPVAAPAPVAVVADNGEPSGLSGVLAVAPPASDEALISTDSTIEVPAETFATSTAGPSGETAFELPVYPGALDTQPVGAIPGDTAILGTMPMTQPGMMPMGMPQQMPGYPMMPGYGQPMGYPGYGGYPQMGYPMMPQGYPMAPQMPGYPMMPQSYPGMPMQQPEAPAAPSVKEAPVKLPDPETTGLKEAPPPPPPAAPVAGAPPAASGSDKPSNTAADIIKNYMQRRTNR